jgi:hypothetical protein
LFISVARPVRLRDLVVHLVFTRRLVHRQALDLHWFSRGSEEIEALDAAPREPLTQINITGVRHA